jgi:hypothetical protein
MGQIRILAALLICFAASTVLAQDPTKVEPTHYRISFENEHAIVISIHYGPHEKSGIHEHPGGVVVNITKAHLRFTDPSGKVQDVWGEPGEARWFPSLKHRVENIGDTPYNGVYIAFRGKSAAAAKESSPELDPETQKAVAQVIASLTR